MERIEAFDIIKGIGIILMIVAHTYGPNSMSWDFISAFHMPLFFIVAGYFYKQKPISELLKKNVKQLLIPYLTLCLIVIVLTQTRHPHAVRNDIEGTLNGMGPGWFLLSMFMVRIVFHYIVKSFPIHYLNCSLLISLTICCITYFYNIPSFLAFFPCLVSLFFVAIGYYIRMHSFLDSENKHSFLYLFCGMLFWLTTSLYGKVEMSQCVFKLLIVDFCGSLGGTFIVYKISKFIDKSNGNIKYILSYAGKYSIVILFFHCIDYCVPIWYLIEPYITPSILLLVILILRLLFVTACVIITLHTKHLRHFFMIK